MLRRLLSAYRKIQYEICGRYTFGIMQLGTEVNVEPFRYEINHGDVVHPCVRYIPEGFLGHKWWMVYTPYYNSDASLEQPVLCYAENDDPETPPTEWLTHSLVNDKIKDGYNSDPTLLYTGNTLYVYWRENYEKPLQHYYRATYVAKVTEDGVEKISEAPIVWADDSEIDAETCPTFMPTFASGDGLVCYAMHLQFHSKTIRNYKRTWKRIAERIVLVTDLLGIYSQQKHYGIAIWKGETPDRPFKYVKTVKFSNCNKLYRPWHMDFFEYGRKRYAIVQTNMSNADLCLAESCDGETFTFFDRPLITNKTIGKVGIYKPCAGVTPQGTFYLYYTAQNIEDRSLNKLYLTEISFNELLSKIK